MIVKYNLSDTSFVLIIKIDSIERLENLISVVNFLYDNFITNIIVVEVNRYVNNIIKQLVGKKVKYYYIHDDNLILYRTKHINSIIEKVKTVYLSIWDVDVISFKEAIIECLYYLRNGLADVAYPYNGKCYETSFIFRELYFSKFEFNILSANIDKMNLLYNQELFGGAFFISKDYYISSGGENENHYGWGNEDYDRYYRYKLLKYRIHRSKFPLFHLTHPRTINSTFVSNYFRKKSINEINKLKDKIEK